LEFQQTTLDNGLEIIAECNSKAYSCAVGFFVRTGSRDEDSSLHGVSHFLEHMAFKGTPTRSAADVNRELDEIGSAANAYTSEEHTVYHAAMLPEYLERGIDILSDMMRPSLREDDFETEKQVILEEIAKYDDQPPFGAYERIMEIHFGDHSLSRSVLGTIESVKALTAAQMQDYFRKRYSASNMVLVGSGKIDFDEFVKMAEQRCTEWDTFDASRNTERAPAHFAESTIEKDIANQQYVIQACSGPSAEEPERFAARMLSLIIGDDSGSRMFWDLIDSGRAEWAGMSPHEYQGTGLFLSYLCCAPEDCQENLQIVNGIIEAVQQEGVTEKELLQARSKICSHVVLRGERPMSRLYDIGSEWLQRRKYQTLREMADGYRNVSLEDIAKTVEKFPLNKRSTVTVVPAT
jgi:predicted Zn-dependent peptidase